MKPFMKPLPQSFFARNTVVVAKELIGKIMEVKGIKARIVETEAYCRDEASHAYQKTERSRIMFETYGHVYVYLIYGMYYCLNFTTEKENAGAVLIRAVEPLNNFEQLRLNRQLKLNKQKLNKQLKSNRQLKPNQKTNQITNLCSGPGKLCQALGIDKKYNGVKLGEEIKILDYGYNPKIIAGSRIGITKGKELPWRFYAEGNEFVSNQC